MTGGNDLERERELNNRFLDGGVHLATSEAFFGEENGWFRITFTVEKEVLQMALGRYIENSTGTDFRIITVLNAIDREDSSRKTKGGKDNKIKL